MDINIIEYLKVNPNASLREYNDFLEDKNRKSLEELVQAQLNKAKFFKSLSNKYYRIKFNTDSKSYIHLGEVTVNSYGTATTPGCICYSIYRTSEELRIKKENNYSVNLLWFKSPLVYDSVDLAKEISEEEYNEATSKIKEFLSKCEF
jgi:hypothetical protein